MIPLGRRRTIIASRNKPQETKNEEVQKAPEARQEVLNETAKVRGPKKMCPVCNKVPNYYFHRKNCKG